MIWSDFHKYQAFWSWGSSVCTVTSLIDWKFYGSRFCWQQRQGNVHFCVLFRTAEFTVPPVRLLLGGRGVELTLNCCVYCCFYFRYGTAGYNVAHRSDATSRCALNVTALPVMRRCLCAALAERCLNVRKVYLERGKGGHCVKRETKCKKQATSLRRCSEMLRGLFLYSMILVRS